MGPSPCGHTYNPNDRRTMMIDVEFRVESDPLGEERTLWRDSSSRESFGRHQLRLVEIEVAKNYRDQR